MKIYTKTGDNGETDLYDGTRAQKSDQIFDLLGALDEVSSHLGLLILYLKERGNDITNEMAFLRKTQQTLLNIGSIIATPNPKGGQTLPIISEEDVSEIETRIDRLDSFLQPLVVFILQGGTTISESQSHVCRTVTRRTEREMIKYGNVDEYIFKYINRLSDYFFTLARYCSE